MLPISTSDRDTIQKKWQRINYANHSAACSNWWEHNESEEANGEANEEENDANGAEQKGWWTKLKSKWEWNDNARNWWPKVRRYRSGHEEPDDLPRKWCALIEIGEASGDPMCRSLISARYRLDIRAAGESMNIVSKRFKIASNLGILNHPLKVSFEASKETQIKGIKRMQLMTQSKESSHGLPLQWAIRRRCKFKNL